MTTRLWVTIFLVGSINTIPPSSRTSFFNGLITSHTLPTHFRVLRVTSFLVCMFSPYSYCYAVHSLYTFTSEFHLQLVLMDYIVDCSDIWDKLFETEKLYFEEMLLLIIRKMENTVNVAIIIGLLNLLTTTNEPTYLSLHSQSSPHSPSTFHCP